MSGLNSEPAQDDTAIQIDMNKRRRKSSRADQQFPVCSRVKNEILKMNPRYDNAKNLIGDIKSGRFDPEDSKNEDKALEKVRWTKSPRMLG